ncbi:MAG: hypothetical protein GY793_02630 [Proteobacteria bacterium]|nr:hypothetical protein [Pseudomonadota bacterium]
MKFDLEKLLSENKTEDGKDEFPEHKVRFTDDKRTEARLLAVQAVFMHSTSEDKSVSGVITESLEYFGLKSAQMDKKLFAKIAEKALSDKDTIIKEIEEHLDESWSFARLNDIVASILVASVAELFLKETPVEILVSEYMALARAFVEQKEVSFIHGILGSVANKYKLGE